MPATFRTGYMQPDSAGVWLLHCHVNDHIAAGMLNFYVVNEKA
jgi:manganese oxidase